MDPTSESAISGQSPEQDEALEALLHWYQTQGRKLPWRETNDPYRIWVIETLLQQTQITQAQGRIERFLARFPSLEGLAQADLGAVLEVWQGLGYYQRAHNLHRAAKMLIAMGGWERIQSAPDALRLLTQLPGIGDYTARAILSFAGWGAYLPVDGNLVRVLSRLWGTMERDRSYYQQRADALPIPWRRREVAFALMDLAQLLCKPRRPKCLLCPLAPHCKALQIGTPEAYPPPGRQRQRPIRYFLLRLYTDREGVALVQRPARGLWGGLWTPPMEELTEPPQTPPTFSHELTHFRLWGYVEKIGAPPPEASLIPWERLPLYGLPAPIFRLLAQEAKACGTTFPTQHR